ncbi:MAG: hypothetical protein WBH98_02975 [Bacteroidales bacterium]
MTISDIITLISLVIAIVAIISEKNRKHLLLKFSHFDFLLYLILFLLINYFVFYDSFYTKGYFIDFLYFEHFGLSNPSNYSYLISIGILISIFYKILFSFYPNRKKKKVLKYYKSLIENNEISMLLDLIEKYHIKDIKKYIETSKNDDPEANSLTYKTLKKTTFKQRVIILIKHSKLNKYSYARDVLHLIINDPAFIKLASNLRPYFFSSIFSTFKKEKIYLFPPELINQFVTELINKRNFWLIKELKQSEKSYRGQPDYFFEENKIIASLIQDVSVSDANEIWIPFGEGAISEIESEKQLGIESRLCQQYRNDDMLWEYKVFISIKFFNILIIESIVQRYKGVNFHLQYYNFITEKILENLLALSKNDFEKVESNYHFLIEQMNANLLNWLKLANEFETDIFHDIINCIGGQIYCVTKNQCFGEERSALFVKNVLNLYCDIKQKAKTEEIRTELGRILKKPSAYNPNSLLYIKCIDQAWTKFDKIPHRDKLTNEDNDYFEKLKQDVIKPMGLNNDQY